MPKIVILKLAGIKYSGDSIGDDIRIEIDVLNEVFSFNKKLKKGSDVKLNLEISQFTTNQSSLDLPISIRIIEKDPVFNDTGSVRGNIKISPTKFLSQSYDYRIDVKEKRGIPSRSYAVFYLTLEISVFEAIRYAEDADKGWLLAVSENGKTKIDLPANLKVKIYRIAPQREYFTIMEGVRRGQKASVQLEKDGSSYLLTKNPHTGPVKATYSISRKILAVNGKKYLTKDYPSAPWKKGIYDIEIPDTSHKGGHNYPEVKYATTWFRVGHSGDRYIHVGRNSLGCITLTEQNHWDELYSILIKARKGDSMSIGTLQVTD